MKLEIDIDEDYYKIICKRVEEHKPYHSPYEYEVIADGKPQEQEPILDKIRAEIEQNAYPIVHGVNNHELGMTLYGILQILDKYKAESED